MAKKPSSRPSLSSTLGQKVELKKPDKDLKQVEQELRRFHPESGTEAQKPASKPPKQEEMMRTTVFVPKSLYKRIKVFCAGQDDMKIKDFITEAIEAKAREQGI